MRLLQPLCAFLPLVFSCTTPVPIPASVPETVYTKPPVDGSRIAWDYTTLRKIAPLSGGTAGYNGYARLIERPDKSLLCVYEASGSIEVVSSTDGGRTWAGRVVVAAKEPGLNMSVPEILELSDKSLLVSYNPRPTANNNGNRFGIRTIKSGDGGATWANMRVLYEAGAIFDDGCWEPAAIQLPSGEVQLYFSNEGIYTTSGEQNISLLRSADGGLTWTKTPEIVSFRAGRRDGMPVPILLNGGEIAFSIEDNAQMTFKPYIIRNALADNWKSGPVGGGSPNRNYALSTPLADAVYGGAPYLRQLPLGETVLGFQSTEIRATNDIGVSRMMVYLGSRDARNFDRPSEPFDIRSDKSGLWNSLAALSDNSVIALTTTNSYAGNSTETWMIRGYVIPEQTAQVRTVTVDGDFAADGWPGTLPVFVGHKTETQVRGGFAYNDEFLFVGATVTDANVYTDSATPLDDDGVFVSLDATNKSADVPTQSIVNITISADGRLLVREGSNGAWMAYTGATDGIKKAVKKRAGGYDVEVAIPWKLLGGKPALNTRIGYNLGLINDTNGGPADYTESIDSNRNAVPYTWSKLTLR